MNLIQKTATLSTKTTRDLLHSSPQHNIVSDAGVYDIVFKICKLKYIGLNLEEHSKNLNEHRRDINVSNLNSALLQHILSQIITSTLMLLRC